MRKDEPTDDCPACYGFDQGPMPIRRPTASAFQECPTRKGTGKKPT